MTKKEYLEMRGFYTTDPLLASDDIADGEFMTFVDEFRNGIEKANQETQCDCCGQKVLSWKCMDVSIPIIVQDEDKKHIEPKPMKLCESCANAIMYAYYREAEKHNRSGWIGVLGL